jgi:ribosomal protein L6P/L9E
MTLVFKQKYLVQIPVNFQLPRDNLIFFIKSGFVINNMPKLNHICFGILGSEPIQFPVNTINQLFCYKMRDNLKIIVRQVHKNINRTNQLLQLLPLIISKYFNIFRRINSGVIEKMKIIGVGYIILLSELVAIFDVGFANFFAHDISTNMEWSINNPPKKNIFKIKSLFEEYVKNIGSFIQNFHIPDVYRGKGICYYYEILKFKQNKKTK